MSETPAESSTDLLHRYVRQGSEEAFRRLIAIHAGMVYAAAERRLGPLRHMAADVSQAVFILLARRARVLPEGIVISAWLHRQTVRQSLNVLRSEHRRQTREQIVFAMNEVDRTNDAPAWPQAAPELDEALLRLPTREREVLMLRYFEDKTLAGVAGALGISEDAAQKRVARALEKLRCRLAGRGAAAGVTSLAGWLGTNAAPAAPHGLVSSLAGPALAAGKAVPAGWVIAIVEAWRRYPLPALLSAATLLAVGGGLVLFRSAATHDGRDLRSGVLSASREGGRFSSGATTDKNIGVLTLDEIVSALEREAAAPQNLRTQLRMDALIAQVRQTDMPAFAELAEGRFSIPAKAVVFPRILKAWAKHAPEAAMDFLVAKDLLNQTAGQTFEINGWDANRRAGIASEVYRPWLEREPEAAARWIADNLNAPALQRQTYWIPWTAASYLAALTAEKLALTSVEDMVAFAVSLPDGPARKASMAGVAGELERPDARSGWDSARWSAATAAVTAAVQNDGLDPDVLRRLAASWAAEFPDDYRAWLEKQPPGELQIYASLGPAMDEPMRRAKPGIIEGLKRQWSGRPPRTTPAERLAIASAALKHVSPERVPSLLRYIAENWQNVQGPDKILGEWIHREAPGLEADAALIFTARRISNGAPQDGLALAEMVSDSSQREMLITGLMRRWHSRYPEKARSWLDECQWPVERVAHITRRISKP